MNKFTNKVALITGGGTGIGRATAHLLSKEGISVGINYSKSKIEAETTVTEIIQQGGNAFAFKADVAKDDQVKKMIQSITKRYGRIDFLINNAGRTRAVPPINLDGIRESDFEEIYSVNVKGTFFCSRAAIAQMRKNGKGHIINVASVAGLTGLGSSLVYSSSKAAVINLTKGLAYSQAPEIQVNCVIPGLIETRWVNTVSEEFVEKNRKETPMNRAGKPEDIANAILGLLLNDFITGASLVVDGGLTM